MIPPRALLLAAGRGTRLRPLTDRLPKCLVPVGGRPLLDYWLIQLAVAGVWEIVINTHHLREPVQDYIAAVNRRGGQRMTESFESQLLGSAGTISANRAFAEDADDLFLIYADNYSGANLSPMLEFHRAHGFPITMMLFRTTRPRDCGIAEVSEDGRIVAFEEKPLHPRGTLANAGVFVVKADAYREIADAGAFDLGRDVLPRFASRMRGWIYGGCHTDVGTPEGYAHACLQAPQVNGSRSMDSAGLRRAVFLQREGVLIEHQESISDEARPVEGAAQAVTELRRSGYACIVLSPETHSRTSGGVHQGLDEQMCEAFAARGVVFDAVYPTSDPVAGGALQENDVGPAISQAASDLKLDLAVSWRIDTMGTAPSSAAAAGVRPSLSVSALAGTSASSVLTPCSDFRRAVDLITDSGAKLREISA